MGCIDLSHRLAERLGGTLPDFRPTRWDTCSSLLLAGLMLLPSLPSCSMVGVHGQHMGQMRAGLIQCGVRESRMYTEGHVFPPDSKPLFFCFWCACFPSDSHAVISRISLMMTHVEAFVGCSSWLAFQLKETTQNVAPKLTSLYSGPYISPKHVVDSH
jgi:hypothetical protein